MAVSVSVVSASGKTLFATAVRLSDGAEWRNAATVGWEAAGTSSLTNRACALSAGSSEYATQYDGTFAAGMGDAGNIRISIHDDALTGDLVVDAQDVYVANGDEVPNASDVKSLDGSIVAAVNLKQQALAIQVGAVATAAGSANSTTAFDTDLPTEDDDYYGDADGGLVVAFVSGTSQQFQTRRVVASTTVSANTRLTVEAAFNGIPADDDTFVILGRITELS